MSTTTMVAHQALQPRPRTSGEAIVRSLSPSSSYSSPSPFREVPLGRAGDLDRRMSRDDLYIGIQSKSSSSSKSITTAKFTPYHTPIRNRPPPPPVSSVLTAASHSPGSPSSMATAAMTLVPSLRTETPDSMMDHSNESSGSIGMALGSPSAVPSTEGHASWQREMIQSEARAPALEASAEAAPRRPKWRLFGRSKSSSSKKGLEAPSAWGSSSRRRQQRQQQEQQQQEQQSGGAAAAVPGAGRSQPRSVPLIVAGDSSSGFGTISVISGGSGSQSPDTIRPRTGSITPEAPRVERKASSRSIRSVRRGGGDNDRRQLGVPSVPLMPPPVPRMPPLPQLEGVSAASAIATKLLLDVEIPDVRLERYSVMFGGVLSRNGSQVDVAASEPDPQPSLLLRRQATLERLRMIDDYVGMEFHEKETAERGEAAAAAALRQRPARARRDTEPQLTTTSSMTAEVTTATPTSTVAAAAPAAITAAAAATTAATATHPGFSLFPHPQTPGGRMTGRNSPFHIRSLTSPALIPSPSRESFGLGGLGQPTGARLILRRPSDQLSQPTAPQESSQQQQGVIDRRAEALRSNPPLGSVFPKRRSRLILEDSLTEIPATPAGATSQQQQQQRQKQPPLHAVAAAAADVGLSSSPSAPSSSASSIRLGRSGSSASSAGTFQTHATKFSIDESDPALRSAVEISIARQISVSQQQRHMLQPLQAGRRPAPRGGGGGGAEGGLAAGAGPAKLRTAVPIPAERMVETRMGSATLVTPPAGGDDHQRRSELVVLEDA